MRVVRSFGFIDLCGFTSFTDAHGDEDAVVVLGSFRAVVREVASRRGVRLAKWLGDGAMFVSLDCRDLLETVLEIEHRVDLGDSPLALRAGVATGAVILFEGDDHIGSAVNLAARLCDLSPGHEVLATTEFEEAVPPWADASPVEPLHVPGFAHPVEVLRVVRADHPGPMVVDPVCRMELPADALVTTRVDAAGVPVGFCSDACAAAWDEGHSGPLVVAVEA